MSLSPTLPTLEDDSHRGRRRGTDTDAGPAEVLPLTPVPSSHTSGHSSQVWVATPSSVPSDVWARL